MLPRVVYPDGSVGRPFVYPIRLADRLERRYEIEPDRPLPLRWLSGGTVASVDESAGPWLPLGGDPLGRDVLARLLYGARLSLGVASLAAAGAVLIGLIVGAPAGFFGGRLERVLMAVADFILVLPAMYVVLACRAALPLVLATPQVFAAITIVLAAAGWPVAARGVRAIVAAERRKEYADAAYALGAHPLRILLIHMLPATYSFLLVLWTMLVPAFVLAEATLSLVGLGFPVPTATWGAMLRDGWEGGTFTEAPWLMAPAAALVLTVFSLQLVTSAPAAERPDRGSFS
jgi:peptide/nickel transport system permease protein